ncbi:MAG: hypothetical protein J4F42_12570 [Desulfurellaceae bacterium]|nr:hypothetical protein [Desulfurellaceae bacterium]
MNIQIFGLKKCADTRKAQRFFKERRVRFQFVDLADKGLSKGELRSVAASAFQPAFCRAWSGPRRA